MRMLVVAGLVLVLAGCGSSTPTTAGPSAVALASPTTVISPSAFPRASAYPDGIPAEVGGQPVIRGTALGARISNTTDASPFLAGGWVGLFNPSCPTTPEPSAPPVEGVLLPPCRTGYVLADAPGGQPFITLIDGPGPVTAGAAVFRVHVHDLRAAGCSEAHRSACEQALVVDAAIWIPGTGPGDQRSANVDALAGRSDDGLPRSVGGQPVLRAADVLAQARATGTDAHFLVGVWLDVYTGPRSCPIDPSSHPPGSWLHGCPAGITPSDDSGRDTSVLRDVGVATFRFAAGLVSGPAVLQVHVHDRRAGDCGGDAAACDRMIVVDTAVWAGDAFTDPRPLTVEATLSAIRRVDPTVSLQLLGDGDMRTEAGLADARSLFPGALAPADRQLAGIYVLPSVAAMHRALPAVEPGAAGSLMPAAWHSGTSGTDIAGRSYSLTTRWLVVENVALSVFTLPTPSAADRAYLDQLTTALGEVSP